MDSSGKRLRSSIWGRWTNTFTSNSQEPPTPATTSPAPESTVVIKVEDETWHVALYKCLIQEYMQYLQTLGFIPIPRKNASKR